ncbi:hypothetical protein [Glutamicibacter uratoxydans]|uniref:hypothetical protein n=1 Tax=Glutamicibacter uratoxydans TaxID=43667 RepID=UPI001477589B|nr:hypothetical protein [Glutamicibacter uratoxydans]
MGALLVLAGSLFASEAFLTNLLVVVAEAFKVGEAVAFAGGFEASDGTVVWVGAAL